MIRKNYLHSQRYYNNHYRVNEPFEGVYHGLLKSIKAMLATLPNEQDRTVIELDRKRDATSVFGMHDFLAPSIYFSLECDEMDRYWIYYAFNKSTFKKEIEAKFEYCSILSRLKVKEFKPNFDTFYKAALAFQPPSNITVLRASQL